MPSDLPRFTFRVEQRLLDKLRYIADNNFRTSNKELEFIVRAYIASYEAENGPIEIREE